MWFSPDCSTCSALYDLGINENLARSQKANLNYLICLELYDFLFSFRMHYGLLRKNPVNKQDTYFRSCKILDPSICFKTSGQSSHVIAHKRPAPISSPIPLGQYLGESTSKIHCPWSPLYKKFQEKRWALRIHKKLFVALQLVNPGQKARSGFWLYFALSRWSWTSHPTFRDLHFLIYISIELK